MYYLESYQVKKLWKHLQEWIIFINVKINWQNVFYCLEYFYILQRRETFQSRNISPELNSTAKNKCRKIWSTMATLATLRWRFFMLFEHGTHKTRIVIALLSVILVKENCLLCVSSFFIAKKYKIQPDVQCTFIFFSFEDNWRDILAIWACISVYNWDTLGRVIQLRICDLTNRQL